MSGCSGEPGQPSTCPIQVEEATDVPVPCPISRPTRGSNGRPGGHPASLAEAPLLVTAVVGVAEAGDQRDSKLIVPRSFSAWLCLPAVDMQPEPCCGHSSIGHWVNTIES